MQSSSLFSEAQTSSLLIATGDLQNSFPSQNQILEGGEGKDSVLALVPRKTGMGKKHK